MERPLYTTASSTVFAITELREAILHEYALDLQQEWLRGPVVELFPLQRVNHAFTASLQSIHLRNFMCLDQGSEPASPIFWFLTKLNMYHEPRRNPDPYLERVEVRTHITDREGAEQTWVVPRKWASEESSWRNIEVFPQNYDGPHFQMTYKTRLRGRSADEVEHTLRRQDNPTLGSAYAFIEDMVRSYEPEIRELQLRRAEEAAERERESGRLRIAFYNSEINATYPRGSTPPAVRVEYRERYWAERREEGRDFRAWQVAQRQREKEGDDRSFSARRPRISLLNPTVWSDTSED